MEPRIHAPNLDGMMSKPEENPNTNEYHEPLNLLAGDGLDKTPTNAHTCH
jgi:hypothetical protein